MANLERRIRRERIVQTAAFIGALLVLVVVLGTAVIVQFNRQEAVPRLETVTAVATVASKSAPMLPATAPAYPAPEPAPTLSVYPAPGRPAGPAGYPPPTPTDTVR